MGIFDTFDLGNGSLLDKVITVGLDYHKSRLVAQQNKRAARGGKLAQQVGWGGMTMGGPAMGFADVMIGETIQGGDTQIGPFDYSSVAEAQAAGEFGNVVGGSSSSAGARYDRCGRMIPAGFRMNQCGDLIPVKPRAPTSIEVPGPDGQMVTYLNRGRAVLFAQDLSAVKRVQRVAASCSAALSKSPTKRRSSRSKKRGRKGRRKVGCRTLSAKQLAAGFGGAQYR